MKALLDLFELGDNLQRALNGVRGLRGTAARAKAINLLVFCVCIAPLVWYFDLDPTSQWSVRTAEGLTHGAFAEVGSLLYVLMLILPTAAQTALGGIAMTGFRMAEAANYAAVAFDATTDWPRVQSTVQSAWDHGFFAGFGVLAGPASWLAQGGLLLMATCGFELLFVICFVCALILLKNSMPEKANGQPARA